MAATVSLATHHGKAIPTGTGPAGGGKTGNRPARTLLLGFEIAGMTGSEDVSLDGVIDPARPGPAVAAPPRYRLVGIDFTVKDLGPAPLLDDIDSDASLRGTDQRTYAAVDDSIEGCADFDSGSYQLPAGGSASGCATFQVPAGVMPAEVVFTPLGGVNGSAPGRWVLHR